ncbi:MAG: methylenetetrahydrofolate reductase C-terminal domain-containing protein [Dehalococcoidales bacterium]|nr:methylenetetrahydrofolate reductase C-terminal domain-containing protein [Dehalococcoidales bacterium]
MILSQQKPFEEVQGYLANEKKVFILGCNGCAQSSGSGGPAQVAEMKQKLEAAGKAVTGTKVIDFLCEKALVKTGLRGKIAEVAAADSVLVMTCGVGVQAVAASINKVCHPACNTVNLGHSRGEWRGTERCMECGECVLDYTGGICPLTACTKSLLSGACGGASHGNCEVSQDHPCGWEQIYERVKAKGQVARLMAYVTPRDNRKLMADPKILAKPVFGLEQKEPGGVK